MNKDLSIIVVGRVCQIFIMLASIRLLTTVLDETQVGNYYLIMAIVAFFNLVLLNPPGMYFSRHLLSWKANHNTLNVIAVFFLVIVLLSCIGVLFSLGIYISLDYKDKFTLSYFLIFILCTFWISALHRNMLSGLNILGFRKEFVIYTLVTLLIGLGISILLVTYFEKNALTWLFGIVLSEFLLLGFVFKFFKKGSKFNYQKIKSQLNANYIRTFMVYALPIAATTFLMWGQNFSYRFIVESKYSIEVLSYIAVGMTVASSIFGAIENIAMQYFNPIFLKDILGADKTKRAESWNKMANILIPIYLLCTVYVIAMSPFLVRILVAEKFKDVFVYTMIGALIEFFRVNSNVLNFVAQSELKTSSTVKPYILGFSFTLTMMFVLDVGNSYYLIPSVIAFSYLMVCFYLYIKMKQLLQVKLKLKLLQIILLALPFAIPYAFSIQAISMILSLMVVGVSGIYLLFTIWKQVPRSS